jgi:tripartite-type tricarboxylate transporter receptor subunit TctC
MLRLFAVALAMAVSLWSIAAPAQDYPSKPITIITGFGPGGAHDIEARLFASFLEKHFGKQVLVEPRVGGGGIVGAEAVVKAAPDGYTLLWASASLPLYPLLTKNLRFDPFKDLEPISQVMNFPSGFWVSAAVPAKTVEEFVAWTKANPGKVNFASPGRSGTLMVLESFKAASGANMTEITYPGFAAWLTAIFANEVQFIQSPYNKQMKGYADDGKIKPLLKIGTKRSPLFPNTPTTSEKGWTISDNGWGGLLAPAGTPKPIIDKLAAAVDAYVKDPQTIAKGEESGVDRISSTPAAFKKLIADDYKRMGAVAKKIGIKPE